MAVSHFLVAGLNFVGGDEAAIYQWSDRSVDAIALGDQRAKRTEQSGGGATDRVVYDISAR